MQAYTPQVPTFTMTVERAGVRHMLRVPFTFNTKLRLDRLHTFLRKEKWAVGKMAPLAAGSGGHTDRQAQAEELLFVKDCLGPLRTRLGAVPEKVVAKLLEIGVLALHQRAERAFGKSWADFVMAPGPARPAASEPAAPPAPEAPTPAQPLAPSRSSIPPLPFLRPTPQAAPLPPPELLPADRLAPSCGAEEEQEAASLVELLLGAPTPAPAADSADDELDSFFASSGAQCACAVHQDLALALQHDHDASAPATPGARPARPAPPVPPPAARAASSILSTAATTLAAPAWDPEHSSPPLLPTAFLDSFDDELADHAALLPPSPASFLDGDALLQLDGPVAFPALLQF